MTKFSSLLTLISVLIIFVLLFGLAACQETKNEIHTPPVVELTMVDHVYAIQDSIPSGWVTFQMENIGEETHEAGMNKLSNNMTFADLRAEYIEPLDSLQQRLLKRSTDSAKYQNAFQRISSQFHNEMELVGGGGRLGAGQTAKVTLKLEPGRYAMTCSIRSPDRQFHYLQGMAQPITVTEDSSGAEPPEPDVTLRSTEREISTEGEYSAGEQTIAFHVEEPSEEDFNSPYSFAYLARLGSDTSIETLRNFPDNEHSIAFLSGHLAVPTGQTRYLTVDLKPGRYGWVFPHGNRKYLVQEFTVE